MRIQYVLEHEIAEAAEAFKTGRRRHRQGHTGEVLALASLPDYEPNLRVLSAED
jgi:cell division protein FtsI/penicillin-binding protein 2